MNNQKLKLARWDRRRSIADFRFRAYGILGLTFAGSALLFLLISIFSTGYDAFRQTAITLDFDLSAQSLGVEKGASIEELRDSNTLKVVKESLYVIFPDVKKRKQKRQLSKLISTGAELDIRRYLIENPLSVGKTITLTVPMSSDADQYYKAMLEEEKFESRLDKQQIIWFQALSNNDKISTRFNIDFFMNADSRYPELAGIGGAVVGTFYTLLICLLIAFPLGVSAAIYLEEKYPF